jgi:hypothetical protein
MTSSKLSLSAIVCVVGPKSILSRVQIMPMSKIRPLTKEIGVVQTRRRMHLRMQDNQIGRKLVGLTPADMDRLPHLINTEKRFH